MVSADLRLLNDVGLGGHGNEEVSEVTLHGPMVEGEERFQITPLIGAESGPPCALATKTKTEACGSGSSAVAGSTNNADQ